MPFSSSVLCVCVCVHMHMCVPSCFSQCLTLCDPMDCRPPGSMGFLRQEYWSWLPFPSPGDLLTRGSNPRLPASPALPFPSPGDPPYPGVRPRLPASLALPFPSPGDPPDPGVTPVFLRLLCCHFLLQGISWPGGQAPSSCVSCIAGDSLPTKQPEKPWALTPK